MDAFWSDALVTVRKGMLPQLCFAEDRPYFGEDFEKDFQQRHDTLQKVLGIWQDLKKSDLLERKDLLKTFVASTIVLCGENANAVAWTQTRHIQTTYKILGCLKRTFECDSVSSIVVEHGQLLRWCLEEIHPKLTKSEWRQYPGAQHCLLWLLHQITSPDLSQYIGEFLPFALRFVDDWESKNKLVGIHCLDHIVTNITSTELNWYGRGDIIRDALTHLLYVREEEVISVVYPCIYNFLNKSEGPKEGGQRYAKLDAWDEIAKRLFYSMATESQVGLKRCYGKQMEPLIRGLGRGCVRWLTTIFRVVSSYTEVSDPDQEEFRIDILKCTMLVLDLAKERVEFHAKTIFEILVRLLYEVSKQSTTNNTLYDTTVDCFLKAAIVAPNQFRTLFKGIDETSVNANFDSVMNRTFEALDQSC